MKALFHLAYHVTDLEAARRFYGGVLGCREGRSTDTWVDFDFFDHQISLHLGPPFRTERTGRVGDVLVPMPHFGLVLTLPDWQAMARRLEAAGTAFVLPPQIRYAGEPGEPGVGEAVGGDHPAAGALRLDDGGDGRRDYNLPPVPEIGHARREVDGVAEVVQSATVPGGRGGINSILDEKN